MLGIEVDDPPHRSDIEKYGIAGKLLTAHRVPSACHADRLAFRARGRQRRPQRRLRIDGDDTINARGIELGMDIINEDARFGAPRSKWKKAKPYRGLRQGTKHLASCRHLGSWRCSAGPQARAAKSNRAKS